jgi:hypothetical protein
VLLGLSLAAVSLSGATAAASTVPTGIQIGPLTVGSGYKLTIVGECNIKNAYVNVTATKTGSGYTFTHSYYGARNVGSTCTTSRSHGSGKMTVKWGKLTVRMKFSKAGRTRRLTEKGCTGTFGHYRRVRGKGTLKMDIHPGAFGKLDLSKAKGEILIYDGTNGSCGGPSNETAMFSDFARGKEYVTGYSLGSRRFAAIGVPDNVSRRIRGSAYDVFRSKKVFTFNSNLSKSKIVGFGSFLSGSLSYKASSTCTSGYTTGSVKGKLVLHDPVLGRFALVGRHAYLRNGPPDMYDTRGTC